MKILTYLFVLLLSSCTSRPQAPLIAVPMLRMTEIGPNKWTALTRQNLEHLLQIYDLSPYLLTLDIQIQSQALPHSHPVLTLNTRFAEQPNKLLATFIHEQLHWWVLSKTKELNQPIEEIKAILPTLPKEELGSDVNSAYLETIICFLEYKTMIQLVNKKEANKILKDFINTDKVYPWINTQMYLKFKAIEAILNKHKLGVIPARYIK
jgi:hypothetical protein